MEPLKSYLHRPYFLYREKRNRWIISSLIPFFVWFFIFTFGVFKFDYFTIFKRFYLTGIYALGCWAAMALCFFVIQDLLFRKLTLGNTLIISLIYMSLIGCSNFLLTTLLFRWEEPRLSVFLHNQLYTLSLGLIIAPLCILGYNNYSLRKRYPGDPHIGPTPAGSTVRLESEYRQGSFELDAGDLLFIKSADNYIDAYFIKGQKVGHLLIRNTLSAVEKELEHHDIVRCHRSYIINLRHTRSAGRKTGRLRIQMDQSIYEIPVSRGYRNRVISALDRLKGIRSD